jgi:hypothetical protein
MIWLIQIQMTMTMKMKIVFLIVFLFSSTSFSSIVLFLIWSIFSKLIFRELIFSELIVLVSTSFEIVVIRIVIMLSVTNNSWDFDRNSFQWDSLWCWKWIVLISYIFVFSLLFIRLISLLEVFDIEILQWWSFYSSKFIHLVVTKRLLFFSMNYLTLLSLT